MPTALQCAFLGLAVGVHVVLYEVVVANDAHIQRDLFTKIKIHSHIFKYIHTRLRSSHMFGLSGGPIHNFLSKNIGYAKRA